MSWGISPSFWLGNAIFSKIEIVPSGVTKWWEPEDRGKGCEMLFLGVSQQTQHDHTLTVAAFNEPTWEGAYHQSVVDQEGLLHEAELLRTESLATDGLGATITFLSCTPAGESTRLCWIVPNRRGHRWSRWISVALSNSPALGPNEDWARVARGRLEGCDLQHHK